MSRKFKWKLPRSQEKCRVQWSIPFPLMKKYNQQESHRKFLLRIIKDLFEKWIFELTWVYHTPIQASHHYVFSIIHHVEFYIKAKMTYLLLYILSRNFLLYIVPPYQSIELNDLRHFYEGLYYVLVFNIWFPSFCLRVVLLNVFADLFHLILANVCNKKPS